MSQKPTKKKRTKTRKRTRNNTVFIGELVELIREVRLSLAEVKESLLVMYQLSIGGEVVGEFDPEFAANSLQFSNS